MGKSSREELRKLYPKTQLIKQLERTEDGIRVILEDGSVFGGARFAVLHHEKAILIECGGRQGIVTPEVLEVLNLYQGAI